MPKYGLYLDIRKERDLPASIERQIGTLYVIEIIIRQ